MVQLDYDKDERWLVAKKRKNLPELRGENGQKMKSVFSRKNNMAYSKGKGVTSPYTNPKNVNHIVTKITGGAKDTQQMKSHFEYISRNGEIELQNELAQVVDLKSAVADFDDEMNLPIVKYKAGSKKTYQIVFSRKGKSNPETLKSVVAETVKTEFPNTKFYYACHNDTDNTHVHIVLLRHSKSQVKHEIKKSKLNQLKKTYCEMLNRQGLEAVFLSESDKQKMRGVSVENKRNKTDERKGSNEYTVLDFGNASYMFETDGKLSFYLSLETKNGKIKHHWSLGLEDEIRKKSVKVGDKITLKKQNKPDFDKIQDNGTFQRAVWQIEILVRDGKKVEPRKQIPKAIRLLEKATLSTKKGFSAFSLFSKMKRYSQQQKLSESLNNGENIKQRHEAGIHQNVGYGKRAGNSPDHLQSLSKKCINGATNRRWLSNKGVLFSYECHNMGSSQSRKKSYSGVQPLRRLRRSGRLVEKHYTVLDFGGAPYKFDDTGKPSYYVLVQDQFGKTTDLWGKSLENMLNSQGIRVGDKIVCDVSNPKIWYKFVKSAPQQETQNVEKKIAGMRL